MSKIKINDILSNNLSRISIISGPFKRKNLFYSESETKFQEMLFYPFEMEIFSFHKDGGWFIFDVGSFSILSCDQLVRDILSLASTQTKNNIASILINTYAQEDIQSAFREIEILRANGLLQKKKNLFKDIHYDKSKISELPLNSLSLDITDACNLACTYCFAKRGQRLATGKMNKDLIIRAIDWFFIQSGKTHNVAIRFFGGEPLLNFDILSSAASYAADQAKTRHKKMNFLLSTNGTLLSGKVIDFLIKYQIKICISVDGPRYIHDYHRKFKNGRGSYNKVNEGIENLRARGYEHIQAQAVLTHPTANRVIEIAKFFRDLEVSGVYLGFMDTNETSAQSISEHLLNELYHEDAYLNLVEKCMVEARPSRFSLSGHDIFLNRIYHGERSCFGCHYHAGINALHLNSTGNLFPCYRLKNDHYHMGNLGKNADTVKIDEIRQTFANDHVDANECRNCWARYLCGGECLPRSSERLKECFPEKCRLREKMQLYLKLYVSLWQKYPDMLVSLYDKSRQCINSSFY